MFIELKNITKKFKNFTALDQVNLNIEENEFFILLGPSGCGKTTLMRIIAGFETPTEGEVFIGGKLMNHQPPQQRPTNMVFQSYALFENMNVQENIVYGLKIARTPKKIITEKLEKILQITSMEDMRKKMPSQLSGGQRQRVALSRALIMEPKVMLLDEPLSALDAKLRASMQEELIQLQQKVKVTFIMVTHDQNEALSTANRIAIMKLGKVDQVGTPEEVYSTPQSLYTAEFVGTMNLFPVSSYTLTNTASKQIAKKKITFETEALGKISLPLNQLKNQRKFTFLEKVQQEKPKQTQMPANSSFQVSIGIRPENVEIIKNKSISKNSSYYSFKLKVKQVIYFGDYKKIILSFPKSNSTLNVFASSEDDFIVGDLANVRIDHTKILIFDQ